MKNKLTSEADRKALMSECDIMMLTGIHENIVCLYEVYVTPDRYVVWDSWRQLVHRQRSCNRS